MNEAWLIVGAVGLGTMALKAAGPLLVGSRELPARPRRVISLLAPALLAALVVVSALDAGQRIVVDARLVGVAAGALAILLRVPLVGVILVAAAATAIARLAGIG